MRSASDIINSKAYKIGPTFRNKYKRIDFPSYKYSVSDFWTKSTTYYFPIDTIFYRSSDITSPNDIKFSALTGTYLRFS